MKKIVLLAALLSSSILGMAQSGDISSASVSAKQPALKAMLAGKSGGNLSVSTARVQIAPAAVVADGDNSSNTHYVIHGFTLTISRKDKVVFGGKTKNPNGSRFMDNAEIYNAMKQLHAGDKLVLSGMTCSGADHKEYELAPVTFTLTN